MSDDKTPDIEESSEETLQNSQEPDTRRLFRSRRDKIFLGLCGGIAQYFKVDALLIRLIFIMTILIGGWGIVAYLIASLLIPAQVIDNQLNDEEIKSVEKKNSKILLGGVLVLAGLFFTFDFYGIVPYFSYVGMPPGLFWSLAAVFAGAYIFNKKSHLIKSPGLNVCFVRSSQNKRFAGVCGGLAEYLNVDSNLIRMIWIVFSFVTFGVGVLIYLLFWVTIPSGVFVDE